MRPDLHRLRNPHQTIDDTLAAVAGWCETETLFDEWTGLIDQLEAAYEDTRREA